MDVPFGPYYQADGITLYNADCRQVLPFLPRFDLLLTDPPYGIGYGGKRNSVGGTAGREKAGWKTWQTDWDDERPARWVLESMRSYSGTQIIWGGNYFSDSLPPSQCWLIWDKGQRKFSLADAELAWTSMDKAVRAFDYSRSQANRDGRVHPTQKPLPLMQWCIGLVKNCESILDPFAGSGTTLVAAKLAGLSAVGIEASAAYCEAAKKRLEGC